MSQKVSNQKRTIATQKTKHKPRATAPDVCKLPDNKPAPFDNWVLTDKLQNGTVFTKIGDSPIWMRAAQVGPPSQPAHAGVNKGVVSGTYCAEARATSWSPDVLTEGKEVVRTNDTTTQNHGNTTGIVDGRALGEALPDPNAFVKLRCAISALEGETVAEGDGADKSVVRKLGFPGGQKGNEPYYLEILEGDKVTFTSTRVDVTVDPQTQDPVCGRVGAKHTEWTWTRAGGSMPPLKQGPFKGKKYKLTETTGKKLGDTINDATGGKVNPKVVAVANIIKPGGGTTTFGNATVAREGKDAPPPKIGEGQTTATGRTVGGAFGSSMAFIAYWNSRNDPLIFEVTATACSGSKKATIRAFPATPIKLSLQFGTAGKSEGEYTSTERVDDPIVTRVKKGMESVKSIFDALKKVAEIAGRDFDFEMFVGVSCGCEIRYVACKEEKKGLYGTQYTPALVGRKWKFWFGASPLLKVGVKWPISLINFVAPGLGEGAATILRKLGVKLDLVFGLEFSLSVTFSVGQDEYDYWTDTGRTTEVKITPSIALELQAGIKLVTLRASWVHTGSIKFAGGDKKGVLLQLSITISAVLELSMIAFEDRWFAKEFKSAPDWGKIKYVEKKQDLITLS
ncbi:PAAR-like domain-containing protein [Polyangium sorediatum]|uniref:DUF4150 domain-containing protein n=1 Tax=Polyangium sorediatum TaxID=889274 RepID=A0ABT6PAJ9_9BACT|nr:PAAR-like domain-containing protein [Polyangium sorediatum]MDI1437282.1 DUF4150 domain-containing protein [Polyangium sorediatum]